MVIYVSSSVNCPIIACPFFCSVVFPPYIFFGTLSLYILDTNPLFYIGNTTFWSVNYLLILFMVSLVLQKIWILIKSTYMACTFVYYLISSLLPWDCKDIIIHFIVFRYFYVYSFNPSEIYFCVYDMRPESRFICFS